MKAYIVNPKIFIEMNKRRSFISGNMFGDKPAKKVEYSNKDLLDRFLLNKNGPLYLFQTLIEGQTFAELNEICDDSNPKIKSTQGYSRSPVYTVELKSEVKFDELEWKREKIEDYNNFYMNLDGNPLIEKVGKRYKDMLCSDIAAEYYSPEFSIINFEKISNVLGVTDRNQHYNDFTVTEAEPQSGKCLIM